MGDYFCIVGLDPNAKLGDEEKEKDHKDGTDEEQKKGNTKKTTASTTTKNNNNNNNNQKPILLDRFPKEDRSDMEFPQHLPSFCFPNGKFDPLKYKVRRTDNDDTNDPSSSDGTSGMSQKKKEKKK